MIVFPAIDVLGGKSVRLFKGELKNLKVYYDDPLEPALIFESLGFSHLHFIDLDGARSGKPENLSALQRIAQNTHLTIQFGGGLRSLESVDKVLELGAERVILGTILVKNLELAEKVISKYGPEKVVAAVDVRDEKVAIEGWQKKSSFALFELAKMLESLNPGHLLVTDIERDGTLKGVNFRLVENLLAMTKLPIIISGGVSSLEDIKKAAELEKRGVEGIVIGKAIYEKTIDLKEAVKFNNAN